MADIQYINCHHCDFSLVIFYRRESLGSTTAPQKHTANFNM